MRKLAFLNILESQTGSKLARQLAQKRRGVHDQPDSLETSSIREFRRNGRIDIDADRWDRGRQQIARRHRVQRRGDEQGQSDTGDCLTHGCLGFYRIRDYAGQRTVIADRAGHHDVGAPPDAGRHNSGLDDPRPDRCFDAAEGMALATDQRELWESERGVALEPDAAREIADYTRDAWEVEL